VNVRSIKKGLAAAAGTVDGLTTYSYCPAAVEVPCFYAGEVEVAYHQTYGGDAEVTVMGYLLTSTAEDEAGQELLDRFLSVGNPDSVVDALEGTPQSGPQTLGGVCDDLVIMQATGYRQYQVGEKSYYGARVPIRAIGVRSQE
jgi:hypothetical protein